MVFEKILRFQGKSKDLGQLSQQIIQQLQIEGYKVQTRAAPLGNIIQAQKAGILRDIITADRAFTILIYGQPDDFTIHIGIGKWIQNMAVAALWNSCCYPHCFWLLMSRRCSGLPTLRMD